MTRRRPRTRSSLVLLALGLSAVPIAVGGGTGPAGAAGTFLDPLPGTLGAPTVRDVDPSNVDTAVLTITNPSADEFAGVDLPPLTDFQWASVTGACSSTPLLPSAGFTSISIDPGQTCTVRARLASPPAAPGTSIEETIYVLAYEVDFGNLDGYYTLRATTPILPATNDDITQAIDISSTPIPPYAGGELGPLTVSTVNGTTVGATYDAAEIAAGFGADRIGSVWFRYTATAAFEGRLGYRSATDGVSVQPWIANVGVTAPASFADLRYPTGNVTVPWSLDFVRVEAGQTVWFQVEQATGWPPGPFTLELFQAPDPTEDIQFAYDPFAGGSAIPADLASAGWGGDGDTFHTTGDDLGDGSAVVWSTLEFSRAVTFNGRLTSETGSLTGSTRPLRLRVFRAPTTARVTTPAVLGSPVATFDSVAGQNGNHQVLPTPITLAAGRYYFAVSTAPSQPTIFFNTFLWSATGPGDTTPPTVTIIDPPTGSTYEVADVPALVWFDATDDSGTAPACVVSPPTLSRTPGQHTVGVECTDAAGNAGFASTTYTVLAPRADLSLRWLNTTPIVIGETGDLSLELSTADPTTAVTATVRVDVPAGAEIVAPTPPDFDPATGTWSPGPFGSGLGVRTLDLRVRMRATGSTAFGAEVATSTAPDPDSTPGNGIATNEDDDDTTTLVRTPKEADLQISLEGPIPEIARPGNTDTATVALGNAGPNPADAVVLVTLTEFTIDPTAPPIPGFDEATGLWTVTVAPWSQETLTLPLVFGRPVVNRITAEVIASDALDPDSTPGNADIAPEDDFRSFETLPVPFTADLSLQASTLDSLLPGETGTVMFEVQNAGPDASNAALVRIDIPAGVELAGPAPAGFDPTTGEWSIGLLMPNQSEVLTLAVRMLAAGDTTFSAEIIGAGRVDPDSTPANGIGNGEDDQATATIPRITPLADLFLTGQLQLQPPVVPMPVGDTVPATVGIANNGPQDATAQVRIDLDGLELQPGATLPADYSAITGIWTVTVPANSWTSISLPVVAARAGTLTLTAEVITSSVGDPDSTPGNGTGNAEDDHASATTEAVAPVSRFVVQYSGSNTRTPAAPLDGATVSGSIAVFVPRAPDIARVEFFLDDPTTTGTPRRVDSFAPYDFVGRTGSVARLFSTRTLSDGTHTITARVVLRNGQTEVVTSTFVVSNPRPATRQLLVSTQGNRSGAVPLDGASVTGPAAVYVPTEPAISRIEFRIDGRWVRAERVAPYDFGGTTGTGQAALVRFTPGTRTVTARIVFLDGSIDTISATFTAQ